jgi:DegV family protein with EDD domain
MVRIVTDTTSGLSLAQAGELGVPMVPQIIMFGADSYRDDTELDTAGFLSKLRASPTLPKTAAPPPLLYAAILGPMVAAGDTVICLHPSSDVSGTVRSATVAAEDYPGADIRIVDTRTIAAPLAAMVIEAAGWARAGLDADTIVARVRDMMSRQHIYFVVDTLDYLHKGGRIGTAKALVGGLLQVKPILTVLDGHVAPFEQRRTARRALARLEELVLTQSPARPEAHVSVMHADAKAEAQALAGALAGALGLPTVPIYELPPAIVTHGGPGVLAASFFAAAA